MWSCCIALPTAETQQVCSKMTSSCRVARYCCHLLLLMVLLLLPPPSLLLLLLLLLLLQLPNTRRLVEIRRNVLRFPLMPPGPLQTDCDEG